MALEVAERSGELDAAEDVVATEVHDDVPETDLVGIPVTDSESVALEELTGEPAEEPVRNLVGEPVEEPVGELVGEPVGKVVAEAVLDGTSDADRDRATGIVAASEDDSEGRSVMEDEDEGDGEGERDGEGDSSGTRDRPRMTQSWPTLLKPGAGEADGSRRVSAHADIATLISNTSSQSVGCGKANPFDDERVRLDICTTPSDATKTSHRADVCCDDDADARRTSIPTARHMGARFAGEDTLFSMSGKAIEAGAKITSPASVAAEVRETASTLTIGARARKSGLLAHVWLNAGEDSGRSATPCSKRMLSPSSGTASSNDQAAGLHTRGSVTIEEALTNNCRHAGR